MLGGKRQIVVVQAQVAVRRGKEAEAAASSSLLALMRVGIILVWSSLVIPHCSLGIV